ARPAALESDRSRGTEARGPKVVQMLAERVSRGRLQRSVEPDPNRPAIAEARDGGAPADEATGIEPAHGRLSPERHELGERNGLVSDRIGESRRYREAQHPIESVQIQECARGRTISDPRGSGRVAHIGSLVRFDLDAHARPGRRPREARVESGAKGAPAV